jgi:hypothetical protein
MVFIIILKISFSEAVYIMPLKPNYNFFQLEIRGFFSEEYMILNKFLYPVLQIRMYILHLHTP